MAQIQVAQEFFQKHLPADLQAQIDFSTLKMEVDFIVYDSLPDFRLIQVAWSIVDPQTKEREVNALVTAMQETNAKEAWLLTLAESEEMLINDKLIHVMPVYQWLLSSRKMVYNHNKEH